MNKLMEHQVARARRVSYFIAEHTITPAIPRVTVLAGQVTTWIGEAETEGSNQVQGFGAGRLDFRTIALHLSVCVFTLFLTVKILEIHRGR